MKEEVTYPEAVAKAIDMHAATHTGRDFHSLGAAPVIWGVPSGTSLRGVVVTTTAGAVSEGVAVGSGDGVALMVRTGVPVGVNVSVSSNGSVRDSVGVGDSIGQPVGVRLGKT